MMKKLTLSFWGLLFFFILATNTLFSQQNFYWVGGTGSWSNSAFWSSTSGGAGGFGVPGKNDTVYFNASSGVGIVSNATIDSVAKFVGLNSSIATFNISLRISHTFIGPNTVSTFGSAGKSLFIEYSGATTFNFTPNISVYNSKVKLIENSATGAIVLNSDLNCSDSLVAINGTINFGNHTITCGTFTSNKPIIDSRVFDFTNSKLIVTKNKWVIHNLTSVSRPKLVKLTGTMNGNFLDQISAPKKYDSLVFINSNQVTIDSTMNVGSLYLDIDTLKIRSSIIVKFDTLYNPNATCGNLTYLTSTALPNGKIEYTGSNDSIVFHHIYFKNISALNTPSKTYSGQSIYQLNCSGIQAGGTPKTFFWIGNSGNWSDGAHWSESSGGIASCFFPKYNDTIVFDQNSFSLNNQIVHLDTNFVVGKMTWLNIPTNSGTQFLLEDSLDMVGNLTFDQDVFVNSKFNNITYTYPLINIKKSAKINLNNCTYNANTVIKTPQTDTVQLINDFVSTDTMAFYLYSGSIKTNNHKLHSQAIVSFERTQKKNIDLGSSLVELVDGWNTDTLDYYLNVVSGSSLIHVGRSQNSNYFISKNQNYHDVIFDFNPADTGVVKFNNAMHSLTIKGGSSIEFNAGDQFTLDTLIIDGGCNQFLIDTTWSIVYEQDTTIDNSTSFELVYNGSTNVDSLVFFGVYKLYPPVDFNDTTFIFGHKSTPTNSDTIFLIDTLITVHHYANIPLYDTTGVSPNETYYYNDTLTRFTRTVHYMLDSVGIAPLVNYGVDTTENGNQAVNLFTSTSGSSFTFNSPNNQKIYGTQMKDIHLTSSSGAVYFGTNLSNNTGWTFNSSPSTVADFSTNGAFCFGDTVMFTNNSTAFSGDLNDLIYVWNYDETQHLGDTNQYVFQHPGQHIVSLTTYYTNSCSSKKIDTIFIKNPSVSLNMSEADSIICAGTKVEFTASSTDTTANFEFFHNNISLGLPSLIDSVIVGNIINLDTISVISSQGSCFSTTIQRYIFKVNPLPTVNLLSSDLNDTICVGDSVTFNASGGISYKYFKNNIPFTSFTTSTSKTLYTLADNDSIFVIGRIDSTGCIDTSQVHRFDVQPLPTVTLTSSATTICQNTPVTFTASGGVSYNFYVNGNLMTSGTSNLYITDSLDNGDVVTVQGFNANGCKNFSSTSIPMIVNNNPNTQLVCDDADSIICSGTIVNFVASGAGTYEFFLNGTSLGASSGNNLISIDSLSNNEYVSVVGTFSGCVSSSDTIQFTVNALPTTALNSSDFDNIICQNTSVTFTGSGATNYQFFVNGLAVTSNSSINTYTTSTLSNGAIVKVVGESNGCQVSDQLTMTVNGIPNVNAISSDADNTLCFGSPLTITGTGANSTYQLSVDGVIGAPQASPTFNPNLAVGTHTIYIVGNNSNGCSNNSSNTFTIVINPIPLMNITSNDADNIICAGQSVTFTASGSSLYQFYINGVSQTSNSPVYTFTTTALTNGQTVSVNGSSLGCTSSSSGITFVVNPTPVLVVTSTDVDNIFCQGANVVYTANGALNYEFLVDGISQGPSSPLNTYAANLIPSGSHVLTILGTSNGCVSTSTKNITINSNPIVSIASSDANNVICSGESVTLSGSGSVNYEFFENGTSLGIPSSNINYTTSSIVNGNTYFVVGSSLVGCKDTSSVINFIVNPNPVVLLSCSDSDSIICSGENVTFTASGASDYQFFIDGVSQGNASPTSTFNTSSLSNNNAITVIGSSLGCNTVSTPIVFQVNQNPNVTLSPVNGTNLCSNENAQIVVNGANQYQLVINGTPQGAYSVSTVFNFPISNNDIVTFNGDLNGCVSSSVSSLTYSITSNPSLTTVCSDIDQVICKDDNISFNSSGALTYEYFLNGIPVQNSASQAYTNSNLTQNDVISVIGYNSNCPSSTLSFTFTVNSMNLDLIASPNEIVCLGSPIQFTASGGDLYEFFVNGVSQGPLSINSTFTIPNTQLNDYISYSSFNNTTGCTQQLGYNYYPNVIPGVQTSNSTSLSFCDGDSVVLHSNFSYGNQWYLNGNPIAGAVDTIYVAKQSGIYSLEHIAGGSKSVWSIGYNGSGTIGNGANINSSSPLQAQTISDVKQICAGYDFVLALNNSGNVFSWGENGSGQLGNGTFTTSNSPSQVATLSNVQQIATTSSSSAALTNSGNLYVWGNNNYGQLGIGSLSIINFPFQIPSLTNVSQIVGGQDHFLILKNDGTVWAVGKNTTGQLGQGNLTNTTSFVQISGLSNISKIGSGENHSFAMNAAGDLYLWGNNVDGQLGLGDNMNRMTPVLSNIKHVVNADGGATHTLIHTQDNVLYGMGDNMYGQLGEPSVISATNYPVLISSIDGVKKISCGEYSSLVLRMDHQVFAAGYNAEHQLQPNSGNVASFSQIQSVDGVTDIEAGKRTTHFIYGNSGSCSSSNTNVTVFVPTQPTISQNGNVLTSSTAISYQWYLDGQPIPSGLNQSYTVIATGNYYVVTTDVNGCQASSDTLYQIVLDIKESSITSAKIYPNPTTGICQIEFSETINEGLIQIVDLTGRLVSTISMKNRNEQTIDLSNESDGTYLIQLNQNNVIKVLARVVVAK